MIFGDYTFRGGRRQSAVGAPRSDVLPPRNVINKETQVSAKAREGIQVDFGETKYILICGLKVGPYVDLLHDEKGQSNSNIHARLFPDISDARLRLKDLEDLIMSPNYLVLQDEDDVMLIQLVFMLKGLHERDVKTGIPAAVYKLADNIDDWNSFAWGTYLWKYTSRMMRRMFKKIEDFRLLKQANRESKKVHKYIVPGFMLPFKPNNQPINFMATLEELILPFYVRYVNWTLNPVESPPRQHSHVRNSPPHVASPARRRMYKSEIETCSNESTTNSSSSKHLEIETSYMSNDTSRLVKKKKTSTKALVKRLLGTHGLEGEFGPTPMHVEPSSDVGEHHTKEMTPIVRSQRKRGVPWYQWTPFIVLQSTPKLKKITKAKKKKW
ncbi:unnamed protein product [Lactuca saligna]|uniref:DUF1985 domain-containing protein n=1 Tax=Lactuca saligna TaxID=75948 RepID=A0AA36E0N2_LACSI|nr:unnamed protein product [Lactuca saligna]